MRPLRRAVRLGDRGVPCRRDGFAHQYREFGEVGGDEVGAAAECAHGVFSVRLEKAVTAGGDHDGVERTTIGGRVAVSHWSTVAMTSVEPSMPIFTASMSTSSPTARSCSSRKAVGGTWTLRTPRVFWATRAVTAAIP